MQRRYPHVSHRADLSHLQPFQFYVIAVDLSKVVLSLLHKPAVFGASEHLC